MDNRKGNWEEIPADVFDEQIKKEYPQVFKVGEVVEIRGSRLRVQKIHKNKITFKLKTPLPIIKDSIITKYETITNNINSMPLPYKYNWDRFLKLFLIVLLV
jgi:hypothetical protein